MISLKKKFLFIHVPKTGGNSIQNILSAHSEDEIVAVRAQQDRVDRFEVRNAKYNTTKHSTLAQYKAELDSATYRSLFKFATIRNPWDRMISFYFSPHRGLKEWDRNQFLALVNRMQPLPHYIQAPSFLNRILSCGKRQLDCDIDCLLRFENLEEDFRVVCDRLAIPFEPLPRRNRSERTHYSRYYDDELVEIVRRKYREEIEFCGYEFEQSS
jgi:hypothetical protein